MIFGDQVTRLRAGVRTTRGGENVEDWTTPDRAPLSDVSIQPVTATEQVPTGTGVSGPVWTGRDLSVGTWRLISAPGVDLDLTSTDRVEYAGMTLQVAGDVFRWPDPLRGGVHHVECQLQRATG